ncbi:MAG: Response regulator receiver protein [Parcubacteria group bacterium GW2011_GWC1_43_30]|nr:MAG: Response regulator receiver protein [Parcubacteria group bacterium GW2011_GWC1_43_30]
MGNKIKVLVVDDTESVAVSIAMILNDGRYDVVTASNGREAWELLNRGEKFDVIISDYNMPKMNGIGLLLNVRNDSRQEVVDIPFILMSGNRAVSDEAQLHWKKCASSMARVSWQSHFLSQDWWLC